MKRWHVLLSWMMVLGGSSTVLGAVADGQPTVTWEAQQLTLQSQRLEEATRTEVKVNERYVGSMYSQSGQIQVPSEYLIGYNQVRYIFYNAKEEIIARETYYFDTVEEEVVERAARKSEVYAIEQKPSYRSGYLPVLIYHSMAAKPFERQMQTLLDNGYTPISFWDLNNYQQGLGGLPEKPFIVTFDDGYMDNYTEVYPVLQKLQVPATYFVVTSTIGVKNWNDHFTWEQAREMEASGLVDIQSHSMTHALFDTLQRPLVDYEVKGSFGKIEQELGVRDVKVFAYPCYSYNVSTQEAITAAGITYQMTSLAAKGNLGDKGMDVMRVRVQNDTPPKDLIRQIQSLTN